jgi:hypothetical protein
MTNTSLIKMKEISEFTLPDDLFRMMVNKINIAYEEKISHNHGLAGNIVQEYLMTAKFPEFEQFLIDCIQSHKFYEEYLVKKHSGYLRTYKEDSYRLELQLVNLWVNYMYKHEFNPIHSHSGLFSFIVFIKVPFMNEELQKISPGSKSNSPRAGNLCFLKPSWWQRIEEVWYAVDKTWEKEILLFPAELQHLVYPFYGTDEPRITVSGNLAFAKVDNPDL